MFSFGSLPNPSRLEECWSQRGAQEVCKGCQRQKMSAVTRGKAQNNSSIILCGTLNLSQVWFSHYYKRQWGWRRHQEITCSNKNFSHHVICLPANAWVCWKLPKGGLPLSAALHQHTHHTTACWSPGDLGKLRGEEQKGREKTDFGFSKQWRI